MHDLNDLMYFVKVVEHDGFSEAGRQLGVPKSRLSRRVADLEQRLGTRLLQRSSRRITLTGPGQRFFEQCRTIVALADAAQDSALQDAGEPQGEVRISCPITLAQVWLTPILPEFMARYPKVRVHTAITNRRVDPVEERMDIVLRVRRLPLADSDQIVRKLGDAVDLLVASPGFLAGQPALVAPEQLSTLPTLSGSASGDRFAWDLTDGQRRVELRLAPRLVSDDMFALRTAALAGAGVSLLPVTLCRSEIDAGRLVEVLPPWRSPPAHVQASFTSRRGMLPASRALLDFLSAHQQDAPAD